MSDELPRQSSAWTRPRRCAWGGATRRFGDVVTQLASSRRACMGIGRTHQTPRPFHQTTVLEPRILLMDQIASNLVPPTVDLLYDSLVRARDEGIPRNHHGITQSVERDPSIASRVFVLEKGAIAPGGTPGELRGDPHRQALCMGEVQADDVSAAARTREEP